MSTQELHIGPRGQHGKEPWDRNQIMGSAGVGVSTKALKMNDKTRDSSLSREIPITPRSTLESRYTIVYKPRSLIDTSARDAPPQRLHLEP